MKVNDALLIKMIESDMLNKGISGYLLADEVAVNPQHISVGANEAVYVCYFAAGTEPEPNIVVQSATSKVHYSSGNTVSGESSLISSHWSRINVENQSASPKYFIRYMRVIFNTDSNEEN